MTNTTQNLTGAEKQVYRMLEDLDVILDVTVALDMAMTDLREQFGDNETLDEMQKIINIISHKSGKWVGRKY